MGALAADRSNVRLTEDVDSHFLPADTLYEVGEVWELEYSPRNDHIPPHVEDVLITSSEFLRVVPNMAQSLMEWVTPWQGDETSLFDGKVQGPTTNGSLYIQDNVPNQSVGFWIPDRDLTSSYTSGMTGFYYYYNQIRIRYVGVAHPPPERISAGTLVRVSLARWHKPRDAASDFPERCYLQISGSY